MPDEVTLPASWHEDWSGLRVAVLGLGDNGFAIADTLAELGAQTTVISREPDTDRQTILDVLSVPVRMVGEGDYPALDVDLVIVAPEWGPSRELEDQLIARGVTVWSDVEFTARVADKVGEGPHFVFLAPGEQSELIAATAEDLLLAAGIRAVRAGAQGHPALDAVRLPDGVDAVVWVLHSSQLARMAHDHDTVRRPQVTVSISDDAPLPHEQLLELYRETVLACVYRRGSGASERAVEDAWVVEGARAIGVGLDSPGMSDLGRVDNIVCDRAFLDDRAERALELCTTDELARAGFNQPSKVEAAIAASAIARAFSVAPELIGHRFGQMANEAE